MKKTFRLFAFAAAAVAMLSSCAKEAVVSNGEDTGKTFTVTAEYTEPNADSKTAFVDETTPYVKWLSTDQIRVYEFIDGEQNAYFKTDENGTHLSADSKKATFDVVLYGDDKEGATSYCYAAVYPAEGVSKSSGENSFYYFEIPASQTLSEEGNFAQGSDVLIGKPVTMTSRISETENLEVQFKRPGTIVALTLKGITAGEAISSVKITAPTGKKIAGRCKVNLLTGEVYGKAYDNGSKNEITLDCNITATGNDKFYFRCLDGTWASGSEVSISVETDAATYTKTVELSKDYVFADGGLTKFGFQEMTRESKDSGTKYTLATSASDLYDGASYIFVGVNGSEYFAMGQQNDNNRKAESISAPVNSVITLPSTTSAYTFQLEAVTGGWAIKDITSGSAQNGKYLYAAATSSNYMKSQENVDKNAIWTILIGDGNKASIVATNSTNRNVMQYNSNSTLFSCYGSESQKPIYLYVDKSTCKEKLATPALAEGSAPAGEVAVGTVIKLTCATEGAAIHYTTDGTEPTATSTQYTDAGIKINDDCTIKAIAVKDEYSDSDVLTLEYTVKVVADPEISISGAGLATVTCGTESALIYYTVGTEPADPTSESTLYEEAVQLTNGQTIKAIAYKDGMKPSAVADATFVSGSYDVTFTHEQEHGTVTVNDDETGTVKVEEGEGVTIKATPAANYHFVSWTITPEVSFTSGSATDATATFTMPASAVDVVAVFEKNPATAPVVTYDFSKIAGFSEWGTSYSEHKVVYTDAEVTFSSANKQSSSITDIPVTKGSDVVVVMKDNKVIHSLTLLTRQWPGKENTVTLHTSTDGGLNYTKTDFTAIQGTPLSASDLGDINAVKFTFSSSSNQIGIAALSLNGGELPKEDASWSVDPISVKVDETKDVTISTNYTGTLNVKSNDESKVTATISGKTITVKGVAEGKTTLTVTGDATDVYNAIYKTIDVTVSNGQSGGGETYVLCTSTSDLVAGAKYIIASGNSGDVVCISNVSNSNNRKTVAETVSDSKIDISDTQSVMTLTLGGTTGAWTLHTDNYVGENGYLASAASGKNNYCRVISNETTCTITFSNNAAEIRLNPHTERNLLRYNPNNGSPIFACYSSGQNAIYLYKKSN